MYARPNLDYVSVVYPPRCLYLIDTVKNIQRHFTKKLHYLCNLSYVNRLQITALELLELSRLQLISVLFIKYCTITLILLYAIVFFIIM